NVITLPKTIDNDIAKTDVSFGFDTALGIATEAVDRLHSTAHSHHRIIMLEIMGHNAGWLALGAGIAGGADVILIPEIPYDVKRIANAILDRSRRGKRFSIVAISEGAMSKEGPGRDSAASEQSGDPARAEMLMGGNTLHVAQELERMTGLESRVTILGHVQRGGLPSAADRLLATQLGTACAELIQAGEYGVMVAVRGTATEPVSLKKVAGSRKVVPLDHPWIQSARAVGTNLGD
ncbi:MAG: 6-phosphofructokinase, partial [Anaerolineales bacterium]|nr:6-phosphofructokinase [Anaerolineales bacterium]